MKKLFRQLSRRCADNLLNVNNSQFNTLFNQRKLTAFWNCVKISRKNKAIKSNLQVDTLSSYFKGTMNKNDVLSDDQRVIEDVVSFIDNQNNVFTDTQLTPKIVDKYIKSLNRNCAPGMDGITAEHLQFGNCELLCKHLSELYNFMLSWNCVPYIFTLGIIIPILKKSSLNANCPQNYRPITLSSVHTKLIELSMLPDYNVSDTQFGFRAGRGTAFGCSLMNDVMHYFKYNRSPMFICSLDAEKCFDSLWHPALFYKLKDKISLCHWMFLLKWYKSLRAVVRWNNQYSNVFTIGCGTRQGSILSPQLFNIFIDGLLKELSATNSGVSIGNEDFNSYAYADDVTLFCATAPGLQKLIDVCVIYASRWKFKFGIKKTKCMSVGDNRFYDYPKWLLGNLETCQGNIIKQSLGISKFSRSTHLLHAMGIRKINDVIVQNSASLWNRIFAINSPTRRLCSLLYDKYMSTGIAIPGTLLHRLTYSGMSPAYCALQKNKYISSHGKNGLIDSLKVVLSSENFTKPYSDEHRLAVLLTKAF